MPSSSGGLPSEGSLDPKVYYGPVPKSFWQPLPEEDYTNLYARAFLPYCDVLFPLVFSALFWLVFRQGWLGFWTALILIPAAYLLGR